MSDLEKNVDKYLAVVAEMLAAEEMHDAVTIMRSGVARIEQTGFDNWDGGTRIWTIYLQMRPAEYARLSSRREAAEEQINNRLKVVIEQITSDWCSVKIVPSIDPLPNLSEITQSVHRDIRQNIFDGLRIDNVSWSGSLEEVEFLQRIFNLQSLPSHDSRYKNAAQDIWQHRVNNPADWADDWVYTDGRFNLLNGPTDVFLKFLCEMVHPVVRPNKSEAIALVQQFNEQLRQNGWQLIEQEKIGGRPRFIAQRLGIGGTRSVSRARSVADALDAGWMQKEIERMENAIERDPALAIGTAKDLVESCCKSILIRKGAKLSGKEDLPTLTKMLAKELQLVPEGIPDEARGVDTIRKILRNLSALTQYIAELRGMYGSGHGRDGKHKGLEPRHARLAVGAAVAFIDFVTETYHRRTNPQ